MSLRQIILLVLIQAAISQSNINQFDIGLTTTTEGADVDGSIDDLDSGTRAAIVGSSVLGILIICVVCILWKFGHCRIKCHNDESEAEEEVVEMNEQPQQDGGILNTNDGNHGEGEGMC